MASKNDGRYGIMHDKILTSLITCLALIFDAMSGVKKSAELYSFKSHNAISLESPESAGIKSCSFLTPDMARIELTK